MKKLSKYVAVAVMCVFISPLTAQEESFMNRMSSAFNTGSEERLFKRNPFVLYMGAGTVIDKDDNWKSDRYHGVDIGVRWLHNFSPYFGWEVIDAKLITFFFDKDTEFVGQFMTGFRGNTPKFAGKMSGYGAFRLGQWNAGGDLFSPAAKGFCYELEFGVNFNHTIYAGLVFNQSRFSDYFPGNERSNYSSFRLGFNFGTPENHPVRNVTDDGWFADFGIGSLKAVSIVNGNKTKYDGTATADFGFRFFKLYHEYFGWDVIKIKALYGLKEQPRASGEDPVFTDRIYPQILTGARGFSPVFHKEMRGYGAFRPGVGFSLSPDFKASFAYELEIGVHLTKSIYAGYAFHSMMRSETVEAGPGNNITVKSRSNYSAFRFGFVW